MSETKKCSKCGVIKSLIEFHRNKPKKDGLCYQCKACNNASSREYYYANRGKVLDRMMAYTAAHTEEIREKSKQSYHKNRLIRSLRQLKRNRLHPERPKAAYKVFYAIHTGKLTPKPCEECGATERIHAHHDDYSKPLDVRWLCSRCHFQYHGKSRRLEL